MVQEKEKKEEDPERKKKHNNILLIGAIIVIGLSLLYYFYNNSKILNSSSSNAVPVSKAPADSGELTSKTWTWTQSDMIPDITTTPSTQGAFTATFENDGTLALATDCNNGNASYEVGDNNSLTITPIASTMMFCEGSSETAYFKQIQTAESYEIENGQLRIMLQGDTGTMIFE